MMGETLKQVRARLGHTSVQMAEALGVAVGSYSGYETQGRVPGDRALDQLLALVRAGAPELELMVVGKVAEVRASRPKRSGYASARAGAQTRATAQRQHTKMRAEATRRSRRHEIEAVHRRRDVHQKGQRT